MINQDLLKSKHERVDISQMLLDLYVLIVLQDPEGLFPCILGHEAAG